MDALVRWCSVPLLLTVLACRFFADKTQCSLPVGIRCGVAIPMLTTTSKRLFVTGSKNASSPIFDVASCVFPIPKRGSEDGKGGKVGGHGGREAEVN